MPWISVRNWRKFQHYDPAKRQPPWIKVYTELMSDEAWLALSGHDRAVLICLWLEYASSRCRISIDTDSSTSRARFNTVSLTRRLNLRVGSATVERLCDAGYIDIVASKTLADGYQDASARAHVVEVETEEEEEKEQNPSFLPTSTRDVEQEGMDFNGRAKTEADRVAEYELGIASEDIPF